jgi:hypothetical protein
VARVRSAVLSAFLQCPKARFAQVWQVRGLPEQELRRVRQLQGHDQVSRKGTRSMYILLIFKILSVIIYEVTMSRRSRISLHLLMNKRVRNLLKTVLRIRISNILGSWIRIRI